MPETIVFIVGLIIGAAAGILIARLLQSASTAGSQARIESMESQRAAAVAEVESLHQQLIEARQAATQAQTRLEETQKQFAEKQRFLDDAQNKLADAFSALASSALSKANEELLKLAKERLGSERELTIKDVEAKKGLIDQTLGLITEELNKVSEVVQVLEKDREAKFGELAGQLQMHQQQTFSLMQTANSLKEVLSSTQARGQLGERVADDVLRVAGFIENINYHKQRAIEGSQDKPDFTFLLPKEMTMNMDVKFPLSNYTRFIEASEPREKERFKAEFLRDVKNRVKEIVTRNYINPEQNTVDYVLLFIPNESIYAFIQEQDSAILDDALKQKVVFCSPLTLFAVLSVIRQTVDNFALERTSNQILTLLGNFKRQWAVFVEKMDMVGKRLESAQKAFSELSSTRRKALERPLDQIEDLRQQKRVPSEDLLVEEPLLLEPGASEV